VVRAHSTSLHFVITRGRQLLSVARPDTEQLSSTRNIAHRHVDCLCTASIHSPHQVDPGLPAVNNARCAALLRQGLAWSRQRRPLLAHTASHARPNPITGIHHEAVTCTAPDSGRAAAEELRDVPRPRFLGPALRNRGHHASQWPAAPGAHVRCVENIGRSSKGGQDTGKGAQVVQG
jgi:hypothetical protein